MGTPPSRLQRVIIKRDEDGAWCAEVPSLAGCLSSGTTREEAVANIREAIDLYLEGMADAGRPLPSEDREVEVVVVAA
jgi:predicted RNase H-like HicB family nuclease